MWLVILLAATGLTISAVAIYYSVVGLAMIFSAATIPIIIMGSSLEVGKLVSAIWLHKNWRKAPKFILTYLSIAVVILMLITSMGIFGFLSRAHSDQNLVSGDIQSKIAIYDEKIKTAKENIEANRKQLKQMDEAVDQVMSRSTDEKGADKANAIRRSQQRDRAAIAKEIETNQKLIANLNEESASIRAEIRKVEAEVGPIKYVAQFIYGETDQALLEKAVVWMIIAIILVFDPLAVLLLIASQMTYTWYREEKNLPKVEESSFDHLLKKLEEASAPPEEEILKENVQEEKKELPAYLKKPWVDKVPGIDRVPPQVYIPDQVKEDNHAATLNLDNNDSSNSRQSGDESIPQTDDRPVDSSIEDNNRDLLQPVKKKIHDQGPDESADQEEVETLGYIQNQEQQDSSIWSRIHQVDAFKASDRILRTWEQDRFQMLIIQKNFTSDKNALRLISMCENIQNGTMRISDISEEDQSLIAKLILNVYKI